MPTIATPPRWLRPFAAAALAACVLAGQAGAMEFSRQVPADGCAACGWILAEGEIDEQTPGGFEDFLAREPDAPRLVRFHSTGGRIPFAMRLGQMIREGGFDTVVGRAMVRGRNGRPVRQRSDCYSACTVAFLGGNRRSVDQGRFGIHRPRVEPFGTEDRPYTPDQIKVGLRSARTFLSIFTLQMGVDAEFVDQTFADPAIRMLDRATLARLRIITGGLTKPSGMKPRS